MITHCDQCLKATILKATANQELHMIDTNTHIHIQIQKDTYTHTNTKIHIYICKYKKYTNLTGEHISSLDITFNGLQLAPICSLRHYSSPNINPSNISSKVHNQQLRYEYNDSIDRAVTGREVGSG